MTLTPEQVAELVRRNHARREAWKDFSLGELLLLNAGALEAQSRTIAQQAAEIEQLRESPLSEIAAERQRQVSIENWSTEHDDEHRRGELAMAASCYAWAATVTDQNREIGASIPQHWQDMIVYKRLWPWDASWWKPKTRRKDLIRAAALIVAEIERLDRAALKGGE